MLLLPLVVAKHHGGGEWVRRKKRAVEALSSLVKYYDDDERILDAVRFETAGMSQLGAKLASQSRLRIVAIGSSVTAGHDGFHSTAWPAVLERRLAPVLDVQVLNHGVGGRNPFPASLCLGPIAGDADVIIREWEYWDFNDGLDLAQDGLETLVAQASPAAVYLLQMDASGESRKTKEAIQFAKGSSDAVAVVSAFGTPFDHLRTRERKCQGPDVAQCPVIPPDGSHSDPLWHGFNITGSPLKSFVSPSKLFINWHPGALGHEVMGNQLAYHLLKLLIRGGTAAPSKPRRRPKCAMSTLPVAGPPSVGDLVDNSTQTLWTDTAVTRRKCRSDCGRPAACFDNLRKCSYKDFKRGFRGTRNDGPLRLRIPFEPDDQCLVYIYEPSYEWNKPLDVANWHFEVDVMVDGRPCGTNCKVLQKPGQYVQGLRVRVPHTPCRPTTVELTVRPLESLAFYEQSTQRRVCGLARNQKCEPLDEWRRYNIRCSTPCSLPSLQRHQVQAFVESVIWV